MAVSEGDRLDLYEWVRDQGGERRAKTLMEYLPPIGWSDVARQSDVTAVRADMTALRAEMATGFAELRVEMHQSFNRQLVWLVTTVFGAVALVISVFAYVS